MRRLFSRFSLFALAIAALSALIALPASAASHLDGVVPLAKDDVAALAQLRATPERHVMIYFGDQAN